MMSSSSSSCLSLDDVDTSNLEDSRNIILLGGWAEEGRASNADAVVAEYDGDNNAVEVPSKRLVASAHFTATKQHLIFVDPYFGKSRTSLVKWMQQRNAEHRIIVVAS